MGYYKKIVGKKIYIAPLKTEDAEKILEWVNDKEVATRTGGWSININNEFEKEFIKNSKDDMHNYGIVRKEDNELIGCCGIKDIHPIHRYCEIGLFIGNKDERGKGYGYETVSLLCDYAFNYLNINSISLEYFSNNENAKKCYEKVGFKEVGRKRESYYCDGIFYDAIIMDILKEEFNKNNEFSSYN